MLKSRNQRKKSAVDEKEVVLIWTNYDNIDFYESIKAEGLERIAIAGGLATGCDIKLLKPYWSQATSILEVGAGYGRVIKALIANQYQGKITAIERCKASYNYLGKQYAKRVTLINEDLHHLEVSEQFGLILWLWSGIADFAPLEQIMVLKQLKERLLKGGHLVIDTMPENILPINANRKQVFGKQVYISVIDGVTVHTYEPSSQEIECYMALIGLNNIERKIYQTDIGRDRWLYVLS